MAQKIGARPVCSLSPHGERIEIDLHGPVYYVRWSPTRGEWINHYYMKQNQYCIVSPHIGERIKVQSLDNLTPLTSPPTRGEWIEIRALHSDPNHVSPHTEWIENKYRKGYFMNQASLHTGRWIEMANAIIS